MSHSLSAEDRRFRDDFEALRVPPESFDHRAHVRLAYVYLVEDDVERATDRMRERLLSFIAHHGVPVSKYHETLTRAWILAVHHFMATSPPARSAADFIAHNPRLLDARIMLSHYSAEVLFSVEARSGFVEPDLDGIPRHGE